MRVDVSAVLTLHHEARLGLARAAVFEGRRPHLYLEGLEHDPSLAVLGTRSVARLRALSGGVSFVRLACGTEAVMDAPQGVKLIEGMAAEVEIIAEARPGKLARAAWIAAAEGEPRRLSPVMSLKARLIVRARDLFGALPVDAPEFDRDYLDLARDQAVSPSGPLPGGGDLSIEPTRGLIACDVDAAGDGGLQSPRAFAKACNVRALADLPRRLRLANLAGLVVVDLIGQRHDAESLRSALLTGFGPEVGRIIVGPIGKFGTMEFTRPWGARPIGAPAPTGDAVAVVTQALRLSEQDRGRPIILRAPAATTEILRPLLAAALDPLAPMLRLETSTRLEAVYA